MGSGCSNSETEPQDSVSPTLSALRDALHVTERRVLAETARPEGPFAGLGDDAILIVMNQLFRNLDLRSAGMPSTTQAAEGLARRRWSVAEIEALVKAGVLDEGERFELIGGEIVPMAPRSLPHEQIRVALNLWFVLKSPKPVCVAGCTTFRLSDDSFVEPDFVFFRKAAGLAALNPKTALLAVEVADSSLRWDLGRKALLYAHCGIPELWVIDAVAETTHVHTGPGLEGYRSIRQAAAAETVACDVIPGLSVTLAALERF